MARYWFCTPRSNLDSWRFNEVENCEILGLELCHFPWAGGDERLLKNLFAAELPDELFRKVITFWAPVWR